MKLKHSEKQRDADVAFAKAAPKVLDEVIGRLTVEREKIQTTRQPFLAYWWAALEHAIETVKKYRTEFE